MHSIKFKFLGSGYLILIIILFLYSFTQVDLGLALTRYPALFSIQRSFQEIGYFNRSLSTYLFIGIVFSLFAFYFYFIKLSLKNKLSKKFIWRMIFATSFVLAFSYNAFSYDIFNYIFDAKVVSYYHENPYIKRPLDFPQDKMLYFMHWTHATYAYGPTWLFLTVPLSFLGMNIFLVTFFLFKFFLTFCYLGSVFLIGKILRKASPKNEIFGLVFFAFNPLVLIESLVSSHNDIAMMFFALLAIYLLINKKTILAFLALIFSALLKDVTAVLLAPFLAYVFPFSRKFISSWEKFFLLSTVFLIGGLMFVVYKIGIQPWYFLWILPVLALFKPNKYLISVSMGFSFGLLMRYVPFLWQGNWDGSAFMVEQILTISSLIIFPALTFVYTLIKRTA